MTITAHKDFNRTPPEKKQSLNSVQQREQVVAANWLKQFAPSLCFATPQVAELSFAED